MAGYGKMTPQQVKAWQTRIAQHPHQAWAAALAHQKGSSTTSSSSTGNKLTPAQAKQLIANQQIVAPGLTAGQLDKSVNAEANVKYGDAQRTLAGAPGRSADFFAQYQQVLRQAQAQQAQTNQAATEGVKSLQGGLDQAAKDQWAGQSAAMTADAANRGATVDPKLADQAKNAAGIRGILTGSYGALLTGQGQNAATGLINRGVNAKQAEGEQMSAAGNQLANLLKDKGAFKSSVRQQLISDAGKNALNAALAGNTLATGAADRGLTAAKTASTKAITAFVQKYGYMPGSQPSKIEQAKLDYFNKHGYFPATGPPKAKNPTGKDAYGNTKAQRDSNNNNWDRAKTGATLIGSSKDTVQSLSQLLITKYPTIPPWMAVAAAQQYVNGYVGPGYVHRLVQHGVSKGYATHKAQPPATPDSGGGHHTPFGGPGS